MPARDEGCALAFSGKHAVQVGAAYSEIRSGKGRSGKADQAAFGLVWGGDHFYLLRSSVRCCWLFVALRVSDAGNAKRFTECDKLIKTNLSFVKNISDRLSQAIKASGKSKGALAAHLGVPQSSVSRWLAGGEPRSERLTEIAKFLGVDVKWLMSADLAENSANPKKPGIGETAHGAYVVQDDVTPYRANVDPVAAAFAKIREGLDLLEQLMKNPPA